VQEITPHHPALAPFHGHVLVVDQAAAAPLAALPAVTEQDLLDAASLLALLAPVPGYLGQAGSESSDRCQLTGEGSALARYVQLYGDLPPKCYGDNGLLLPAYAAVLSSPIPPVSAAAGLRPPAVRLTRNCVRCSACGAASSQMQTRAPQSTPFG
jgi:hypothetical protein